MTTIVLWKGVLACDSRVSYMDDSKEIVHSTLNIDEPQKIIKIGTTVYAFCGWMGAANNILKNLWYNKPEFNEVRELSVNFFNQSILDVSLDQASPLIFLVTSEHSEDYVIYYYSPLTKELKTKRGKITDPFPVLLGSGGQMLIDVYGNSLEYLGALDKHTATGLVEIAINLDIYSGVPVYYYNLHSNNTNLPANTLY